MFVRSFGFWVLAFSTALGAAACSAAPYGGGEGGGGTSDGKGGGALGLGGGSRGADGGAKGTGGATGAQGPTGPASTTSLCQALASWSSRCGKPAYDVQSCEQAAASYDMSQLAAAQKCAESQDCNGTTLDSCIQAAFSGGSAQGGGTCDSCAQSSCGSELAACKGDAECVAFVRCAQAAQTQADAQACADQHPHGAQVFQTLDSCLQNKCSAVCK